METPNFPSWATDPTTNPNLSTCVSTPTVIILTASLSRISLGLASSLEYTSRRAYITSGRVMSGCGYPTDRQHRVDECSSHVGTFLRRAQPFARPLVQAAPIRPVFGQLSDKSVGLISALMRFSIFACRYPFSFADHFYPIIVAQPFEAMRTLHHRALRQMLATGCFLQRMFSQLRTNNCSHPRHLRCHWRQSVCASSSSIRLAP